MGLEPLYPNEIYHIFNRSIAGFRIFGEEEEKQRFLQTLIYYLNKKELSLSVFLRKNKAFYDNLLLASEKSNIGKIIAYCVMPDHYHLVVKIRDSAGFSRYINDVENSYTRYFNTKKERKGPLWEGRFKRVRVKTEEQLLHLTRYIHLNPTSDNLVDKPEKWKFSSYRDYISNPKILKEFVRELSIIDPKKYKEFVESRKDYQRKLKEIRKLLFKEI